MMFDRRGLSAVLPLALLLSTLLFSGCGEPHPATQPTALTPTDHENPSPPVGIWLDEDPYLRGYSALAQAVAALGNNIRVLHTGAHPDDERSDLLAYLVRGRHFRTAYLSANRGEGGQNGIGPEKGMALGVIRTEEMLAARRIDGAEQYFLSKDDFGFSKTAEETLKVWGHQETLREMVHFIRWYRPHVIISAFSGTPFDGHGHHQAIALLTREAFDAAADPQFADDLPPWRTQILYHSLYNDPGDDQLPGQRWMIDTGVYDPLLGKTYHQMAMDGRSQHRSQDMGQSQSPGPYLVPLRLWAVADGASAPAASDDPFAALESADSRRNPAEEVPAAAQAWEVMQEAKRDARQAFARGDRDGLLQALTIGHAAALRGRARVHGFLASVSRLAAPYDPLLAAIEDFSELARGFERALVLASGVNFDLRCDKQFLIPGQSGTLTVRVIPQTEKIAHPTITFDHADLWQITPIAWTGPDQPTHETAASRPPFWTFTCTFTVPADAPYTQPAYRPMAWSDAAQYGNHHQATMDLPPIVARLTYSLASAPATQLKISTSAQYVWTDPRFGERREMVKVVPPVSVTLKPAIAFMSANAVSSPPLDIAVENLTDLDLSGNFNLQVDGSRAGNDRLWYLPNRPGSTYHYPLEAFVLDLPAGAPKTPTRQVHISVQVSPSTKESQNRTPGLATHSFAPLSDAPHLTRVAYEHIRPHNLYAPAETTVLRLNASLPANLKVAYIAGPGTDDEMIDALRQMGAAVTLLDEAGLAKADFNDFDTVFAGVRAYEVRPDLVAANPKLLDWVKAGGTLIVLYQKYPFAKLNCAPARFQYQNPHDRVTEEDAEVKILQPDHALLSRPNHITAADFQGWHQDRGLYFFAEENRDPGYTALLSCHDEGESPKTGGLLVYAHGQGRWVYCAYALHLQIPEAVPGAWRILANIASYSREPNQ